MPRTANAASDTGRRYPLGLRTTFELRDKLQAARAVSGRSLSQEVEHRLERSLDQDDVFGGPELRRITYEMASAFALAGQFSAGASVPPKEWLANSTAVTTALANVVDVLARTLGFDENALYLLEQAIRSRIAGRQAQVAQERRK